MEKRSKKIEIISIFLCFISLLLLLISYSFYIKTNKLKNVDNSLKSELYFKSAKMDKLDFDLNNINKEIEVYSDLDKSIENIKLKYFKLIKELEDKILSGESDKKIAYITFDDGPYYNTHRVLDILDQYDVKATFFTISMNGEYCYDNKQENCFVMYKEYLKRGHTIANHTYTHAIFYGLYSSVGSFMDAIIKQEEHIKNQTGGYITNITRFPGGSSTAKGFKDGIIQALRERGYGYVDWTAEDGDGKGVSSREKAWNTFTSTINDKIEVILFHDYNQVTTDLLPEFITYLRDNGYELFPLFYESNMINK